MASSTTGGGLIQSLGIGSGLDIQSLVSQLVTAERTPVQSRLTREASAVATQVSALGSLKGALAGFQSTLSALDTVDQFAARTAASSDPNIFTATAGSKAVAGTYAVEVRQLAQPEQIISTPFSSGAAAVIGTGTLRLSLGAGSTSSGFSLSIDGTHNTLAGIRDAINGAADNPGIGATLVYGTNGAQLVLTSNDTGAAHAISVSASGGDGGLAQLAYAPGATANFTESQVAQDAIIVISGVEHHNASNVIDTAIDGVTLSLKTSKQGSTVNLVVANDQNAALTNIRKFVTAYNDMQAKFTSLGKYDLASKTGGPLVGDWLLTSIGFEMGRGATDRVAGATGTAKSLAAVGITTGTDGTLSIDSTKLGAVLKADPAGVAALFGGTSGIAVRLNSSIDRVLGSAGAIAARDSNLSDRQKTIQDATQKLNDQMNVVQQRYMAQFSALDSLLAQLQSTSNYLTQQLANAASIGNGSSTKSG